MIEKIHKLIKDVTGYNDGKVDQLIKSDDLNFLDSLQMINLIVGVEELFNISLEPEDIEKIDTITYLIKLLGEKGINS